MATRAVNKTAKEGEQNARLLLSRGALSAMAIFRRAAFPSVRRWRCTAPYPLLAPAAPALCLSCFWRGRSPSPARRFFAGRAAVIWCGANPGARPWQDLRECVFGRLVVAIYSRGAFLGSPMTKCSRNAFPSVRQWQDCALMRSWPDWQRQYSRAMRPQVPCRGKISPRCVPGRQSVASFALHASRKWPRTGKSPVRGKIRAPCIRNELALAGYARHASEKPRKSPFGNARREDLARKDPFSLHGPLESCTAHRFCHPSQRQTARALATPEPPNSASRQS